MAMRLYDTARRAVVPFEPGPVVSMYVCGITPYDSTHLGHAATYLAHDLVIRRLEDLGHEVRMVRNFTDVDDPLYAKAATLDVEAMALAEEEIARFRGDAEALDLRPAVAEPRVSTSIPEIVAAVGGLLDRGHAYTVDGTTYFDVRTSERYGTLSNLSESEMIAIAAERGGTPDDPRQRNPLDFVLWKPSAPGEDAWPAPFGLGRPGWHIECTAMCMTHLDETIDLHGGGNDLVFPHHESEIAQSEALTGRTFARHWMHVGMVAYQGEKMSKSLGNLVFVSELRKVADPRAIRLALLPFHYRAGFEWFDDMIDQGTEDLALLQAAAALDAGPDPTGVATSVRRHLDDDLDTGSARLALLDHAHRAVDGEGTDRSAPQVLRETARLLGVDLDEGSP
ncbi:MAG: cysteine--tRNA ligase [Actinomycetota bacterium]